MGCSTSSPRNAPPLRREVHVALTREGGRSLGLRLAADRAGIITRGVSQGGILETWNAEHPALQVGRGDRILSVNGVPVDNTWNGWCAAMSEFRKNTVHFVVRQSIQRSGTSQQELPRPRPVSRLDRLLPEGFMDDLPRVYPDDGCASGCPICLDEQTASDIVQLPCRHAFHVECIEKWLMQCPTYRFARCPTCRAQIRAPEGARFDDVNAAERGSATVAEGSGPESAEGGAAEVVQSGAAELTEGGFTEVAEGSGREIAEGSDTGVAEGRVAEVAEGSGPEVAEHGGSEAAEGGGPEAAEGGDQDVAEATEDYPLQASV